MISAIENETSRAASRSRPRLHRLRVLERSEPTQDSICLSFAVPPELYSDYIFQEGQFVALEAEVDGELLRRNYSICSSVHRYHQTSIFSIGIRAIAKGRFSNWARDHLHPGSSLAVMTPDGRFVPPPPTGQAVARHATAAQLTQAQAIEASHNGLKLPRGRHHLAFAGGSGITPILSILQTRLMSEPSCRFSLVYGNRHRQSIMFFEALEDLKNQYMDRFQLIHVLSEEEGDLELHNGLLDQAKCAQLLKTLIAPAGVSVAYLCGPEPMMLAAQAALIEARVDRSKILMERFGSAVSGAGSVPAPMPKTDHFQAPADHCSVTINIDGKARKLAVPRQGPSILQMGLSVGMPLPFACQAAVCCTCRAKVMAGKVQMDKNYTLRDDEIAQGFVLTCQAHPLSDQVILSFDER